MRKACWKVTARALGGNAIAAAGRRQGGGRRPRREAGVRGARRGPARDGRLRGGRHASRRGRALPEGCRPLAADPRAVRRGVAVRPAARNRAARPRHPGGRRRRSARRLARRHPEGHRRGRSAVRARGDRQRHREPRHRRRAARPGRLGRGGYLQRDRDRPRGEGARDLARPARPGSRSDDHRRAGQRRGSGARPTGLVAAGGEGGARRGRAAADAVGLDGAGDVPRPEPAPAQSELERDHPAHAERPADRGGDHQREPRQRRLLCAPQPARQPRRLRGRRARRRDRDPVVGFLGEARGRRVALRQLRRAGARDHPRRRDDQPRRERGRRGPGGRRGAARRRAGAGGARRAVRRRAALRPGGDARLGTGPGRRGLLAGGRRRRGFQRDAGLRVGGARHVADRRGARARRSLLAGLLARPARTPGGAEPQPADSGSSTTGRRPSSR